MAALNVFFSRHPHTSVQRCVRLLSALHRGAQQSNATGPAEHALSELRRVDECAIDLELNFDCDE